jgi:DNA invertase Pin-like site-specific DNA recombinase
MDYSRDSLGISSWEVFDEVGTFDREVDRPAYQEMMRRVRQGEFTHILVETLDNLLHDYDDLKKILAELMEHEVMLVNMEEIVSSNLSDRPPEMDLI